MKYFLLLLLPFSLFASKILSYNIYDRTDRADIMITFDTPFSGKITQNSVDSKIIIKLEGASINAPKIKKVNSPFLQSLSITPLSDHTQVVASAPSNTQLIASKTSDGYGLRLRFKAQTQTHNNSNINQQKNANNPLSGLPTKKDEGISTSYYIVVGFLLLAIMTLFYIKRKMQTSSSKKKIQNTWLFKSDETEMQTPQESPTATENNFFNTNGSEVSIRFQKALNSQNSVVMLDFGSQSYLVLMGKGNILLDKFTDNKPKTQEEFQNILQTRHEQLEEFLGESSSYRKKEPLQAYKERAASIAYGEEL